MRRLVVTALVLSAVGFLLYEWITIGARHTSDAKLVRNFLDHRAEFDALLAELQVDTKLKVINTGAVNYGGHYITVDDTDDYDLAQVERIGLTKERWAKYQRYLRDLGIVQIGQSDGRIEFRVDPGTPFNGDSYKGYEYSLDPPKHQKTTLDSYRISSDDKDTYGGYYVSKPLGGNWRLYLFVNG